MSIKITVDLILDDEAGDEIERALDKLQVAKNDDEIQNSVVRFLKRLGSKGVEDIKPHIVGVEDIW